MRHFLAITFILSIITSPAFAQDVPSIGGPAIIDAPEDVAAYEASTKERLKLAQKMHEIWPIRQKVENALDNISERVPEKDRLKFKSGMRKAIDFDELEEQSIQAMADIYSGAELNKMIEFYGSKEGRSISTKNGDYERSLSPLMIKMVDKALLGAKMGSPKSGSQSLPR